VPADIIFLTHKDFVMTGDREGRQFRLLTVHCVLWSLAMSLASGFVGAYLLRLGFGIAVTLALYAVLLGVRFSMRALLLPVIRRLGMRKSMLLGTVIAAFQFLPLIRANELVWMGAWILIVSAGECLYWPICHAAIAVCGGGGRRGRQIAFRQVVNTVTNVAGPVVGGIVMTRVGPSAEFGIATAFCLLSMAPLFWFGDINLGGVPSVRRSLTAADPVGLCAFAADGWMCAGIGFAWPLMLFSTLGSSYDRFGWASGAAGVVGAVAGLGAGIAIDRGHRRRLSRVVSAALLVGVALRVASGWAPWAALAANAMGAAVGGLYYPVLMSVVYDRAKRSGSAYQFHLSAEAGWDGGAILGCLVTAAVAWSGVPVTLSVLPAALGVLVIHRCVRAEARAVKQGLTLDPEVVAVSA
jgi:MFS transporter, DHA1 family, inner membrane transport protein